MSEAPEVQPSETAAEAWKEFPDTGDGRCPAEQVLGHVHNWYWANKEVIERELHINWKFKKGDRVRKTKGSNWHGKIVGFYSTELTPIGYAVESELEKGSVQIYPEAALEVMVS